VGETDGKRKTEWEEKQRQRVIGRYTEGQREIK
jgi:hypothetical protein